MNAKTTVGTAAALVLVFLGVGAIGSGSASLLSIKYPDKNPAVPAGSLIAVSGTSVPSNATHTNCNVAVQINQHGYIRASPQGPKGVTDYTKWTAISTSRIQPGTKPDRGATSVLSSRNSVNTQSDEALGS